MRALGATAVPLLSRKLRGDDERQASWAYFLLARLGGERAAAVAREVALDDALGDERKALALALLNELGAGLPDSVRLRDPKALRAKAARDLLGSLDGAAEVARAVDLLIEQVTPDELPAFVEDLVEVGGREALPLVMELLLRDDVKQEVKEGLFATRDRLAEGATTAAPPRGRAQVRIGAHADGRRAVVAIGPAEWRERVRAVSFVVDPAGRLARVSYQLDLARSAAPRWLATVEQQGFALAPSTVATARRIVGDAARATRSARGRLPREYYLGRDLCGVWNEHAAPTNDLLAQGVELLDRGDARRAQRLLERHVAAWPDDAEGRSCLASCLLELGEHDGALRHFAVAARLEPRDPIRRWNLAHAAKRAGRLGGCYLALLDYLELGDRDAGAAGRIRSARRYLRLFERYARLEHPDAETVDVARGEELFFRAYAHLEAGRAEEAVTAFEAVIKLVPSHYPSWGNLGAAYVTLHRPVEAERCLLKALEYRPDYEVAQKNLAVLKD